MRPLPTLLTIAAMLLLAQNSIGQPQNGGTATPSPGTGERAPANGDQHKGTAAEPHSKTLDVDYLFQQLDRNGDGKIDRKEGERLSTILSGIMASAGVTAPRGAHAKGALSPGSAPAVGNSYELFHQLDANRDGSLTKEEFSAIAGKLGVPAQSPAPSATGSKGTNLPGTGSGGSSSGARETGPTR
jgi:hypothetical protein